MNSMQQNLAPSPMKEIRKKSGGKYSLLSPSA